jgi:hypothetical protein
VVREAAGFFPQFNSDADELSHFGGAGFAVYREARVEECFGAGGSDGSDLKSLSGGFAEGLFESGLSGDLKHICDLPGAGEEDHMDSAPGDFAECICEGLGIFRECPAVDGNRVHDCVAESEGVIKLRVGDSVFLNSNVCIGKRDFGAVDGGDQFAPGIGFRRAKGVFETKSAEDGGGLGAANDQRCGLECLEEGLFEAFCAGNFKKGFSSDTCEQDDIGKLAGDEFSDSSSGIGVFRDRDFSHGGCEERDSVLTFNEGAHFSSAAAFEGAQDGAFGGHWESPGKKRHFSRIPRRLSIQATGLHIMRRLSSEY